MDRADVQEIIELYQDEASIHIFRREPNGQWSFDVVDELDATLRLPSVDLDIPLSQINKSVAVA